MLGIGAGGVKCTEVRTSWLSSGHALPCSREVCGQIGFLRGYGVDIDLGLEQASKEKGHIILACPMASDPSADLSSPSVGSPYDSLRIRIPKSESPPGLDLQTDASSAHDFILQFTFQKIKSQKNKNSIHGVNCTLQIIHIVLLYGTEDLHLTQKYDTIAHFFHKVSFDFLRPRFSIFWGKIHALMEENSRIRLPDRRIQQLHVKIRREYFRCLHQK